MIKGLMWGVVVVVGVFVGVWAYFGGFSQVEVKSGTFEETTIVFATHRGAYEGIGASWADFDKELEALGLAECDSLAVYLDPPSTEKDALRSVIGCRIDDLDPALRSKLADVPTATLPAAQTVQADFPFRGFPSFFIAPMKVYPALSKSEIVTESDPVLAIEVYGRMGEMTSVSFHLPHGIDRSAYNDLYAAFD